MIIKGTIIKKPYFCRATVKEHREDQRYIVMFVDYGTTSLVHAKDMRKAYNHYSNTPAYARRIVLNEIVPPQGEGLPTNWTKEQISNLYDVIHYTTGKQQYYLILDR